MNTILAYDGSFEGFLNAIFYYYEYKITKVDIQKSNENLQNFFDDITLIESDTKKAKRLWSGLKKIGGSTTCTQVYTAFLSEQKGIENKLFYYIKRTFNEQKNVSNDYADPIILSIAKICKMVGREKHRMDAFVRFKLTKDGYYFATIAPDFNVLPLNAKHFKNRYADQKWIIYDLHRHYGLYYDLNSVETITIQLPTTLQSKSCATLLFSEEEFEFQKLWKTYFTSTNIVSRKNMKLHLQHVPKRYWKYLSEKQP